MNPVKTAKLFADFPNLYCDKDAPTSVSRMQDGFYCDDGWYDLIYATSAKLEKIIIEYKKNNKDDPKPPRAFQVKQKFGSLCLYMTHYTDDMRDVIDEAEVKSHRTCEKCGRSGKLRNDKRFVQTLCDHHHQNR